ncbi:MAG: FKBP-type peptidyl-prolyl cis-trans isomerase [Bacteroidales bacterium]|nr:FKBP-type peptidyl-prolyl cis-trans isomerase [Bacteroidales bacterium]
MILILAILCFAFAGCKGDDGFIQTESGFSFKRCTNHDSAPKASVGDVIYGEMKILLNDKQPVASTYGSPGRMFVIGKSEVGSIDEFLLTLHVGDSAVMTVPADSMSQCTSNIVTRPGDKLYIYMTVSQIISRSEISSQQREVIERQKAEEESLTDYVLNNYSRANRMESGLFYLSKYEGQGAKVQYGKRIYVNYSVKDTSGKLYDTNVEQVAKDNSVYYPQRLYKPFDFILGDDALIAGWTEGLSYMHVGGKATLVIPSKLAYGETGMGQIPPYTPLVFEISVVNMTDE